MCEFCDEAKRKIHEETGIPLAVIEEVYEGMSRRAKEHAEEERIAVNGALDDAESFVSTIASEVGAQNLQGVVLGRRPYVLIELEALSEDTYGMSMRYGGGLEETEVGELLDQVLYSMRAEKPSTEDTAEAKANVWASITQHLDNPAGRSMPKVDGEIKERRVTFAPQNPEEAEQANAYIAILVQRLGGKVTIRAEEVFAWLGRGVLNGHYEMVTDTVVLEAPPITPSEPKR